MLTGMGKPRFNLRALFVATAAIAALLASVVAETPISTSLTAIVAATMLPAALLTAAICGRGYQRTFCLGALIPAGLLCWFVAHESFRNFGLVNGASPPLTGRPYFTAFSEALYYRVRFVAFGFGLASILAGSTAVAAHWLLADAGDEKRANDQAKAD